ncbi:MAG: UvrD-helicase domain-containing protein, partial [Verrucomicrobiales bacterium]|nr:UvrD-helicase domain-containing protein [Verrucomicrobiales bacterium]
MKKVTNSQLPEGGRMPDGGGREMMEIPSEIILASAGSGKTYQLTNRYLKLLAMGVEAEAIIALTFTRKAAGEFLDAILEKLAGAAADEVLAGRLSGELEVGLGASGYLRLLRRVVRGLHGLNLGTLDSFFVRVIQGLPLELGMGGELEVMGDYGSVVAARRAVYEEVFRGAMRDEAGMRAFSLALKEASYGHEERRMVSTVETFVEENHSVLLSVPAAEKWGNAEVIWPEGAAFPPVDQGGYLEAVRILEERIWKVGADPKHEGWWRVFFDEAGHHVAGASMGKRMAG